MTNLATLWNGNCLVGLFFRGGGGRSLAELKGGQVQGHFSRSEEGQGQEGFPRN